VASALFESLLEGGDDTLAALCAQLVPLGAGDDRAARYALTGLARYVSRPDAERDRRAVEKALLAALKTEEHAEVKHFLLRQLEQCGTNAAVSGIAPLLHDDAAASHAILTLDALGTRKAKRALTRSLHKTPPATQLATLAALADHGQNWTAARVTRKRLADTADPNEYVHLLSILVALQGNKAHGALISALDREEPRIRKAALAHAAAAMDSRATRKWRKKLTDRGTPEATKAEIGALLFDYEAGR